MEIVLPTNEESQPISLPIFESNNNNFNEKIKFKKGNVLLSQEDPGAARLRIYIHYHDENKSQGFFLFILLHNIYIYFLENNTWKPEKRKTPF